MLVNQTGNVSFKGNIIESHAHTGIYKGENKNCTPKMILDAIGDSFDVNVNGKNGKDEVKYIIASNLDCLENDSPDATAKIPNHEKLVCFRADEITGNKRILEQCRKNPKLKPLAVCQAGRGNPKKIDHLLKEHGHEFYGLKFHPNDMKVKANAPIYDKYMKLAEKHKLPCVFHTGSDGFSNPEYIIELAQRHPKVPVVLYHIDINGNEGQKLHALDKIAESIKNKKANLYVDLSWSNEKVSTEAIHKLGEDRVLFGTDIPLGRNRDTEKGNYIKKVVSTKNAIHNSFKGKDPEKIIDKVFYENSYNLFFKKANSISHNARNKVFAVTAGIFTIGALAINALSKSPKEDPFLRDQRLRRTPRPYIG